MRALVVLADDQPVGFVPLVVRAETTRVGPLRVLTYPLHDWGSFYGPIAYDPGAVLRIALDHVRQTPRDWDLLELRWQGAPQCDAAMTPYAMHAVGLHAVPTVWNYTSLVEMTDNWELYWAERTGRWRRRFRNCERQLAAQGKISYLRYRPAGGKAGEDDPRWDLYDACEDIARRSWQGSAANGTTLSHATVRGFLREAHAAAAAAGAVDLNLLLCDDVPIAFIYGYYWRGYVYGLRRGYDAAQSRRGAGTLLLAQMLRDSFARGDRVYDMGVGSLQSKQHFQTRLAPIWRYSHFAPLALRAQLLRVKRWWQSRNPTLIAVGCVQTTTTDAR